jgi:hypothetical protein
VRTVTVQVAQRGPRLRPDCLQARYSKDMLKRSCRRESPLVRCSFLGEEKRCRTVWAPSGGSRQRGKMSAMEGKPDGQRARPEPARIRVSVEGGSKVVLEGKVHAGTSATPLRMQPGLPPG